MRSNRMTTRAARRDRPVGQIQLTYPSASAARYARTCCARGYRGQRPPRRPRQVGKPGQLGPMAVLEPSSDGFVAFGVPPLRYKTRCRIEYAKLLLTKPEMSVTDVGLTIGFSTSSSFVTAFRKATGFTPTGYKRSLG